MGLLTDIVLEAIERGIGPQTDRGIVGTFAVVSCALAMMTLWLLLTAPKPLSDSWGIPAAAASVAVGAAGLLTSVLHLTRTNDRVFATACLMANVGAMASGVAAIILR